MYVKSKIKIHLNNGNGLLFLMAVFLTTFYLYKDLGISTLLGWGMVLVFAMINFILRMSYKFSVILPVEKISYIFIVASNLILTALHYINSRKIEKEKVYDFKFCLLSVLVVTISCLLCNLIYKFTWVRYGVILIIILIVFKFRNKLINSITAMKV